MELLGYWNNDSRVELYEMADGRKIAVTDWNGETWGECWEVFPGGSTGNSFCGMPVYRFEAENINLDGLEENSPEWCRAVEIVGIDAR